MTGAVAPPNLVDSAVNIGVTGGLEPLVQLPNVITGVYSYSVPVDSLSGASAVYVGGSICLGAIDYFTGNPICYAAGGSVYVGN
jgi:hypothetical protein